MGRVKIDIDNVAFINLAQYDKLKFLRNLYRNYNNIKKLALEFGKQEYVSVYVDLKDGLENTPNLKPKQREYIIRHLIYGETRQEISCSGDDNQNVIKRQFTTGLNKISKYLEGKCKSGVMTP